MMTVGIYVSMLYASRHGMQEYHDLPYSDSFYIEIHIFVFCSMSQEVIPFSFIIGISTFLFHDEK